MVVHIGVEMPAGHEMSANPNPALNHSACQAFVSAKAGVSKLSELPGLASRLHGGFHDQMIDTLREPGPLPFEEQARPQIMGKYEARWFPSRPALFG